MSNATLETVATSDVAVLSINSNGTSAKKKSHIPIEDFIRTHETSNSNVEVAQKLGLTLGAVYQRVKHLRKLNIDLKHMNAKRGGPRLNPDKIRVFLESLRHEN